MLVRDGRPGRSLASKECVFLRPSAPLRRGCSFGLTLDRCSRSVLPVTDEPELTPATRDELLTALSYALRFDERGKAHRRASEITAQIVAETLVRYLELAGFVVMKRPPKRPHSTHGGQ